MSAAAAIETENLGRTYRVRQRGAPLKELVALRSVDLRVPRGELFGLLGPNGAGKTTLIKILTTLLAPTSGQAKVAGYDVALAPRSVRPLINLVSGGETSGYGLLTVRENLWLFSQFYGLGSREANRRIAELLDVMHMSDRMHTKSSELSTGMRQKMNIVRGFLTDPEVLFLDEPTLGLDVGSSRDVRDFVRGWMKERESRTLLLTTHHMAEADALCDRIAIINGGRVLACDTPARLKRRLQQDAIFRLETTALNGLGIDTIAAIPGVRHASLSLGEGKDEMELALEQERVIGAVINALEQQGVGLIALTKREPTLEDVFVDLVGRSMADVEKGDVLEAAG
ncbi:MAG: ATP-binding cassette domain-containing protein [Vicinamibacterales bacterium]